MTATDDPRRWHRGSPRQWHREATERLYAAMMREMGERETELTQAFVAENVARLHGATPAAMLAINDQFPDDLAKFREWLALRLAAEYGQKYSAQFALLDGAFVRELGKAAPLEGGSC